MKIFFLIILTLGLVVSCKHSSKLGTEVSEDVIDTDTTIIEVQNKALNELFTLEDAVKILGEPAFLADSSTSVLKAVVRFQSAYKANVEDPETRKTGAIYLLFEDYSTDEAANEKYDFTKTANQDHGIKTLENLGDEAYFHSDNTNFYFIMIRKGTKVATMKVNKITTNTFLDEFNAVAERIAKEM